ncbi:hydroxymethylbilane synthase [Altererythrobacter atlanticus]|uniref:Porphobilinogen deaminase n=1 Tax=Croceibacterium atlanticum TaxID=1267766 RepID=A0A0F7KV84_9SPHN|nr:hydroxymethylbilane synthase [Croceibacterium atlanticum]AKH44253.1 Porphobilinogen deaminase [Croceibacterium atlanticum]MBB5732564.1 hydroxymethylbilane synthase [Croceibacterium atlanticum]
MSETILKLGTRRSPLALAQAEETRARLCHIHGWDENEVELVPVVASGDKVQDRPLAEIGGKALWTKELDGWLAEGLIDASVHSLKDVETIRPESLTIAAILPRADKRDVLLGAESVHALPQGAVIGTSAPRRAAQALHLRPDCRIVLFRGNVATRMARLAAGDADATFLAAAGLARLGQDGTGHKQDPGEWLPAPSQGAIAIECRAGDSRVLDLIGALDHAPSRAEVMAERALLHRLGGNCHSAVAVLCDYADGQLSMHAALFSPDGAERVDGEAQFAAGDIDAPLRLAADLLDRATPGIAAQFAGSQ